MMTKSDKDEIKRLLLNWMLWSADGRGGVSPFPAYNLAPPGKRSGPSMPVLVLDAEDVDVVLRDMPGYWRKTLLIAYVPNGGAETQAKRMRISLRTYWRRVEEAQAMFWERWVNRRDHAKRLHDTQIQTTVERISTPENKFLRGVVVDA